MNEVIASGLPVFDDACNWYGPDMGKKTEWLLTLSGEELAELDSAVNAAIAANADLVGLNAGDFPLPALGKRLKAMQADLLHGRGFAVLRGWPSEQRSLLQSAVAFRGVGAHLGEAVSQNGKGHVLGHVANLGLNYADPTTRGYQTSAELRFHTDGGDIVGLLCVRPSKAGGASKVTSSTAVWNELVRRRPDFAKAMMEPFAFSRWGEVPAGQKRYFEMPLFQPCNGRMIAFLVQSAIDKAQAFEEVPRLSALQKEALKFVGDLADDPAIRLDMEFRPGDMQFLCNYSTFHSRTAYEDWPEQDKRRHLLRLWLSSTEGPDLPLNFTRDFQGSTANGRPAGINVPGVPLVAPLEPV